MASGEEKQAGKAAGDATPANSVPEVEIDPAKKAKKVTDLACHIVLTDSRLGLMFLCVSLFWSDSWVTVRVIGSDVGVPHTFYFGNR